MNVDHILRVLEEHGVQYVLIGGMNFLLRHEPVLTYDVDVWVQPSEENLRRTESALAALDCEWGATESDWGAIADKQAGWLQDQAVYCLTSPHGAIDVFLSVTGLEDWDGCRARAVGDRTAAGVGYVGLSDEDMLRCQEALDGPARKQDRILTLRQAIGRNSDA